MKLPYLEFGDANNPPLVLVHGLFGQGKNLSAVARNMAQTHYVLSVDLRNHGSAPWDDVHDYPSMAEDLYESFASFGAIDLMGHSMGGKAAMVLALSKPEFVKSLLVADIAPVSYAHSHLSYIEAMRGLDLSKVKTRRDADALLAHAIDDAGVRAFLLHSLKTGEKPYWQNNLDALEQAMDLVIGWPEIEAQYEGRTLFVGGENSDYIDAEGREAIKRDFPRAKVMMIKNAGHWIHVEQPQIFSDIMRRFFDVSKSRANSIPLRPC